MIELFRTESFKSGNHFVTRALNADARTRRFKGVLLIVSGCSGGDVNDGKE